MCRCCWYGGKQWSRRWPYAQAWLYRCRRAQPIHESVPSARSTIGNKIPRIARNKHASSHGILDVRSRI